MNAACSREVHSYENDSLYYQEAGPNQKDERKQGSNKPPVPTPRTPAALIKPEQSYFDTQKTETPVRVPGPTCTYCTNIILDGSNVCDVCGSDVFYLV